MTHWRQPDDPDPKSGTIAFIVTIVVVLCLILVAHGCAHK